MTSLNPKTKRGPGILGFIFESEVAFYIIIANFAAFGFLYNTEKGYSLLDSWILYPGNLLNGNYFSIITSGFIHSSWLHLLMNMLGVFIFTRIVERHLGPAKTLFIYFGSLALSMLFATVVYALVLEKSVAIIGASGAVMGMMAAAMLLDPFYITYEMIIPIPVMIKGWMFFYADIKGFLGGEQDGVSHLAHIFGFVSVAFLVYFLSHRDKKKMHAGLLINIFSIIMFLILRNWLV